MAAGHLPITLYITNHIITIASVGKKVHALPISCPRTARRPRPRSSASPLDRHMTPSQTKPCGQSIENTIDQDVEAAMSKV